MTTDKTNIILCGSVEKSSSAPEKNVGVVSVVYVSSDETKVKEKLASLKREHPDRFYMEYSVPLDTDLTSLDHYPSIEISKEDLEDN